MRIELLHNTPLSVAVMATRTCYDSFDKSDTEINCVDKHCDYDKFLDTRKFCLTCEQNKADLGEKDKELINRIGNKMQHRSVLRHLHYTFYIEGMSTKTLLALTRHKVGTEFSIQSSRFTLKKEYKKGKVNYTYTGNKDVDTILEQIIELVGDAIDTGASNDELSMLLPQAYQYNGVVTFSFEALYHFLDLRLTKEAHFDIRKLAVKLYESIPFEHLYLFDGVRDKYGNLLDF